MGMAPVSSVVSPRFSSSTVMSDDSDRTGEGLLDRAGPDSPGSQVSSPRRPVSTSGDVVGVDRGGTESGKPPGD
jgi:hypothetical protein